MSGIIDARIVAGRYSWPGSVSYSEKSDQEIMIASATTDFSMPFGGVTTADVLILESDQALTINFNSSSGTDVSVKANRPIVHMGGAITAVYVTYATGTTANVKFQIYGV